MFTRRLPTTAADAGHHPADRWFRIVFSRGDIYVTNLALPLTPAEGDEPEEDVTTYTVSRIELD